MSSVLIRGMKMPDGCPSCPFVMGYYCLLIGISDDNEVTNYINKRHPNCPLVEIPTPHGRLIDADELDELNIHDISPVDGFCVMGVTEEDIELADTVIEAEGETE